MNREIKFRAWDIENKKMFIGHSVDISISGVIAFLDIDGEWKDGKEKIELMQYTGLKDKNGKEIYEGDLCREIKDGEYINSVLQIVWLDTYKYGVKVLKGGVLSRGLAFPLWQWDKCENNGNRQLEVIGNIYENPELLEE